MLELYIYKSKMVVLCKMLIPYCNFFLLIKYKNSDLLQWSVWHSKTAQPHVCQRLLQLSEQAGVRTMLEAPAGQ